MNLFMFTCFTMSQGCWMSNGCWMSCLVYLPASQISLHLEWYDRWDDTKIYCFLSVTKIKSVLFNSTQGTESEETYKWGCNNLVVLIAWPVLSVWAVALMNSLQFQSVMLYDGTRSFSFLCRLPALHLGFLLFLHLVITFIVLTVSEREAFKYWA